METKILEPDSMKYYFALNHDELQQIIANYMNINAPETFPLVSAEDVCFSPAGESGQYIYAHARVPE